MTDLKAALVRIEKATEPGSEAHEIARLAIQTHDEEMARDFADFDAMFSGPRVASKDARRVAQSPAFKAWRRRKNKGVDRG